jgi:hypothetical protein
VDRARRRAAARTRRGRRRAGRQQRLGSQADAHAGADASADRHRVPGRDALARADRDADPRAHAGAGRCAGTRRQRRGAAPLAADRGRPLRRRVAPELQRAQSRARWIAGQRRDGLYAAEVDVAPAILSPTTATARVVRLRTNAARTGCHNWSGTYELRRIAGAWRISKAALTSRKC